MSILAMVFVGIVAALHLMFLLIEAFLWESKGPGIFKTVPKDLFTPTKAMMQNQGCITASLPPG